MNNNFLEYIRELREKFSINKNILLVQPPQFGMKSFSPEIARNKGYYAFPPLALQYLVKAMKGFEQNFHILDLNYEVLQRIHNDSSYNPSAWLSILEDYLINHDISIIGATCVNVSNLQAEEPHPFIQLLEFIQKKGKYIILAGGVVATFGKDNILKRRLCHFVFEGQSESSIKYLFDLLYSDNFSANDHVQKPGIYFNFNGEIQATQGEPDRIELKGNLIESYKLIPIEKYGEVGSLNPFTRMVNKPYSVLQFLRGCRGRCTFCNVHVFMGHALKSFPVQDVLDEITYLAKERGIRHFELLDDDPLANKEGFKEILKGIINLNLGITWSTNNGLISAFIDEELLTLMKDSGCIGFKIGVESGNAEVLKKVKKPGAIHLFRKARQMFAKFPDLFIGAHYIVGLPLGEKSCETFGQMMDTYNFSLEMDLDWSSFFIYQSLQMNAKNDKVSNFIPSRGKFNGQLREEGNVATGLDVFNLDKGIVPTYQQLEQIWFTFNFVGNYIHNKNLKPGGNHQRFVSWLEAIQAAYPNNFYISLFNGLGNILLDNRVKADRHFLNAGRIISSDEYWRERARQFKLDQLMDNLPKNANEVYEALDNLRGDYESYTAYKLIESGN